MAKYILIIFLSFCNVVWFYNYSLGDVKLLILISIVVTHHSIFIQMKNYKHFNLFFIIIVSIIISLYINSFGDLYSRLYFIYGFIENYLMFLLGSYYLKYHKLDEPFLKSLLYLIVPLCFLTLTNFLFNIPNWHSISAIERYEAMYERGFIGILSPLYSTGFGIARTGWANSLCQFLPIALMLKKSYFKYCSVVLILISILLSSSRGGLLCALFVITVYTYRIIKNFSIKLFLTIIYLVVLIIVGIYGDNLLSFLRISSQENISSGRIEQYLLIPRLFTSSPFWGYGVNGIAEIFQRHGIDYSTLHNTYLRLSLELGAMFTLTFIILLFLIMKLLKMTFMSRNRIISTMTLIIICGLISALFEPQAVFGTVNWYSIWWFSLGCLSQYKSMQNKIVSNAFEKCRA